MNEKTVLLIESGHFIGGVIRSLFTRCETLNVIEASPASSRELIQLVNQARPQVVVLDDTVRADYLSHLLKYMRNSDGIRVVVVNTSSNQLEVYEKQQIPVRQTADFLAAL
jgi:chemotaxis response regulator CheB